MVMADLFAGIGGFSYAGHLMGWQTALFVEKDPTCQAVLKKNFPNIPIYGDIKQFDGTEYAGTIDLVCSGFPCQPFSKSGKRKGVQDDRYLWDENFRVTKQIGSKWITFENVDNLATLENGAILDHILDALESEGYWNYTDNKGRRKIAPFIIPASGKEAPTQRDRLWIIAHTNDCSTQPKENSGGTRLKESSTLQTPQQERNGTPNIHSGCDIPLRVSNGIDYAGNQHWYEVYTRICRVYDGLSTRMDSARRIPETKAQSEKRLSMLGNTIHPAVAFEIFQAIKEVDKLLQKH